MKEGISKQDYQDALEELKEDYKDILYKIDEYINALSYDDGEKYQELISALYLVFDRLKGFGSYLDSRPIYSISTGVLEALLVLKHKKPPVQQEMLDWFLMIYDHLSIWKAKIEVGDLALEPIDSYILSMIKTTSVATKNGGDMLKKLKILIVEEDAALKAKLKSFLEPRAQKIFTASTPANVLKSLEKFRPDIIVTCIYFGGKPDFDFVEQTKLFYKDVPFLVTITPKMPQADLARLEKLSVDGILIKPLNAKTLLENLWQIAKIFYEEKWVKIANKELNKYIESLQPLETSVQNVRKISMDPNSSTKDLAAAITQDPIMTSQVLKTVNSPIYGFRQEISGVNHAVSLLGKDKISAIILQDTFRKQVAAIDLSPYGITEKTFYEISKMRLDLMTFWFSKVSLKELALLSTSALLGNLGQILIAQEAINEKLKDDFHTIVTQTNDPKAAEAQFFNTTTEDVTGDILAYWGLENELVNSIRFSFDLTSAPNEVKHLAIANYVVFSTIPLTAAKVSDDAVMQMEEFLKEMNFNPAFYTAAVQKIV